MIFSDDEDDNVAVPVSSFMVSDELRDRVDLEVDQDNQRDCSPFACVVCAVNYNDKSLVGVLVKASITDKRIVVSLKASIEEAVVCLTDFQSTDFKINSVQFYLNEALLSQLSVSTFMKFSVRVDEFAKNGVCVVRLNLFR